jgi:hypothetical protein
VGGSQALWVRTARIALCSGAGLARVHMGRRAGVVRCRSHAAVFATVDVSRLAAALGGLWARTRARCGGRVGWVTCMPCAVTRPVRTAAPAATFTSTRCLQVTWWSNTHKHTPISALIHTHMGPDASGPTRDHAPRRLAQRGVCACSHIAHGFEVQPLQGSPSSWQAPVCSRGFHHTPSHTTYTPGRVSQMRNSHKSGPRTPPPITCAHEAPLAHPNPLLSALVATPAGQDADADAEERGGLQVGAHCAHGVWGHRRAQPDQRGAASALRTRDSDARLLGSAPLAASDVLAPAASATGAWACLAHDLRPLLTLPAPHPPLSQQGLHTIPRHRGAPRGLWRWQGRPEQGGPEQHPRGRCQEQPEGHLSHHGEEGLGRPPGPQGQGV